MADTTDKDVIVHQQGYSAFIGLMKWGTVACLIVAAIVVLIISR